MKNIFLIAAVFISMLANAQYIVMNGQLINPGWSMAPRQNNKHTLGKTPHVMSLNVPSRRRIVRGGSPSTTIKAQNCRRPCGSGNGTTGRR